MISIIKMFKVNNLRFCLRLLDKDLFTNNLMSKIVDPKKLN